MTLDMFFSPFKSVFNKFNIETKDILSNEELVRLKSDLAAKKNAPPSPPLAITGTDLGFVKEIRFLTARYNLNNLTRTQAYWEFFVRNPEIHWAFLAHLVSRNGGYHMTDLKGELIGDLLPSHKKQAFFEFLERANALIFHDAYPQLLLYEKSKQLKKNYFYLLSAFSVSIFMSTIWDAYFRSFNSQLLTIGFIINEQHYIEKHLLHSSLADKVIDTWQFTVQDLLGLTQVLLPFYKEKQIRLSGTTVQYFDNVLNRIQIGKKLYSMLFFSPSVFKGAYQFAVKHPHTASRSDYSSHLFSKEKTSKHIYSPSLNRAWNNIHHQFTDRADWFQDLEICNLLSSIPRFRKVDITDDYYSSLESVWTLKTNLPFQGSP